MTSATAHLRTGWEPDTAEDDTLLRRYLLHQADLAMSIARAGGGRTLGHPDVVAADRGAPTGYFNAATLLRPPTDWSALLDEVEAFFAPTTGPALLWSPWPTPDLHDRGWTLSGHPPLLVRPPLAAYQTGVDEPSATDDDRDLVIREVLEPAALATWESVAIEGYPLPELRGAAPGTMMPAAVLRDGRLRLWTALRGGEAVSVAASFSSRGIGSLAFGATLPSARRAGTWHRLATTRLTAHPDVWMTGVFSDLSRPGAERLGFVPIARLTLWIRTRPDTPLPRSNQL